MALDTAASGSELPEEPLLPVRLTCPKLCLQSELMPLLNMHNRISLRDDRFERIHDVHHLQVTALVHRSPPVVVPIILWQAYRIESQCTNSALMLHYRTGMLTADRANACVCRRKSMLLMRLSCMS